MLREGMYVTVGHTVGLAHACPGARLAMYASDGSNENHINNQKN